MSDSPLQLENRDVKMSGDYPKGDKIFPKDATVKEGFSKITEISLEFFTDDSTVEAKDMLGKKIAISIVDQDDAERYFSGTSISVEEIGTYQGQRLFTMELRSWLWLLTQNRNNKVFQEKSAIQIIQDVLSEQGFSSEMTNKASGGTTVRPYCIQYRESDYDFICRLLEEEGIHYFFQQDGNKEKMILADSISAYSPVPHGPNFEFHFPDGSFQRDEEHIYDWNGSENVKTSKVTFQDYDFERPSTDLKKSTEIKSGSHGLKQEHYDYNSRYTKDATGQNFAKIRMESMAWQHEVSKGVSNIRGMGVGQTFKMSEHPSVPAGNEHVVMGATHYLGVDTDYETGEVVNPLISREKPKPEDLENLGLAYRCTFEVLPKDVQFRPPQTTKWPEIQGLHTAVVVGPSSEEIYTDEFGRIKVQFHWDRIGTKNENSSIFIRVAVPWSGEKWGWIGIPRIGQEVIVQFEEGNPDRPICTGMLYNKEKMPPYTLDARKDETGIVTRSTKEGNANTFHELIFKDEKGKEDIRFQSERDYHQIIKNDAVITIGMEHKDKGDMTQTIQNDRTETVKEGNHTFTVEKGNETYHIEGNQDITVNGNESFTVQGNETFTVSGNQEHTVSGNTTHTTTGKTTIKANQKIELICGGSKIVMEPAKITLQSVQIEVKGSAMVKAQGAMVDVNGSGMVKIQGGIVKIN